MLHITNGDHAAQLLRQTGIDGDILPWRDCLHLGPVPANLPLAELSSVRADYLTQNLSDGQMGIHKAMQRRDKRITDACNNAEPVTLWFEHDLYDQLQLLQILDILNDHTGHSCLKLICIDRFSGVTPFHGLGQLTPAQLNSLYPLRQSISSQQLTLAKQGWAAVRSPKPSALMDFLKLQLSELPFLRASIIRLLEEYPSISNGLSRTEQQSLQQLTEGPLSPFELFDQNQQQEQARFMGDWGYWGIIAPLTQGDSPLLTTDDNQPFEYPPQLTDIRHFNQQRLKLSQHGKAILAGKRERGSLHSKTHWIGGVGLNRENDWRWDSASSDIKWKKVPFE